MHSGFPPRYSTGRVSLQGQRDREEGGTHRELLAWSGSGAHTSSVGPLRVPPPPQREVGCRGACWSPTGSGGLTSTLLVSHPGNSLLLSGLQFATGKMKQQVDPGGVEGVGGAGSPLAGWDANSRALLE